MSPARGSPSARPSRQDTGALRAELEGLSHELEPWPGPQRPALPSPHDVTLGRVLAALTPYLLRPDAETEEQLLETIRAVAHERLVLLITHRIKTLQAAHRIHVVANGCIVAEGTHQQLLAQGGLYRQLYEHQCLRESMA